MKSDFCCESRISFIVLSDLFGLKTILFSIFLDLGLRASIAAACSAAFGTAFSVWFAWPIGWVSAAVITCFLYQNGLKTIYGAIGGNDAVKAVKCD